MAPWLASSAPSWTPSPTQPLFPSAAAALRHTAALIDTFLVDALVAPFERLTPLRTLPATAQWVTAPASEGVDPKAAGAAYAFAAPPSDGMTQIGERLFALVAVLEPFMQPSTGTARRGAVSMNALDEGDDDGQPLAAAAEVQAAAAATQDGDGVCDTADALDDTSDEAVWARWYAASSSSSMGDAGTDNDTGSVPWGLDGHEDVTGWLSRVCQVVVGRVCAHVEATFPPTLAAVVPTPPTAGRRQCVADVTYLVNVVTALGLSPPARLVACRASLG